MQHPETQPISESGPSLFELVVTGYAAIILECQEAVMKSGRTLKDRELLDLQERYTALMERHVNIIQTLHDIGDEDEDDEGDSPEFPFSQEFTELHHRIINLFGRRAIEIMGDRQFDALQMDATDKWLRIYVSDDDRMDKVLRYKAQLEDALRAIAGDGFRLLVVEMPDED